MKKERKLGWLPKEKISYYFSPLVDEKLKEKYPIKFRIVEILGMIVPLFPVCIWGGVIVARDCNSYWMFLGMVGAFLIGNGLFNIIAISVEQYLGHLVTLLTLVIGTLMVICSLMLI